MSSKSKADIQQQLQLVLLQHSLDLNAVAGEEEAGSLGHTYRDRFMMTEESE